MTIHDYPREIERIALELAASSEELSTIRQQIKDAELDALSAVMEAKNASDGKPLYTNDKARDIALHRSLKESQAYQQDKATVRILEHKQATLEAELERGRREYRIAVIDYERQQLGRRDAA